MRNSILLGVWCAFPEFPHNSINALPNQAIRVCVYFGVGVFSACMECDYVGIEYDMPLFVYHKYTNNEYQMTKARIE